MKSSLPVQIDWEPDKKDTQPIYRQIVQFICCKVSGGEWSIGTQLPSQRKLAEMFGVNRSTIATAMDELTSYGILKGSHGAGTKIISNTWSLMLSPPLDWSEYVMSGFFQPNSSIIQVINRLEFEPDIIRLGTGELDPRLFPQDMWQTVLSSLSKKVHSLNYLEPLGLYELRKAISSYMETMGVYVPPTCILITSGSLQALQLISACLLKRGSTVYTEAPSYLKSLSVFQSAGMKLSGIPLDDNGMQFWKMSSKLKNSERDNSSILYTIPTNHNPTGTTMSDARRKDLMEFCIENHIPIIEDCAYQELCFHKQPITLKGLDKHGMVVYLGTSSKSLAPGLRIGWIIASEPIVQRLGDVKMQTDYGASSVSQWIFTEFLTSGLYERYLGKLRNELLSRRNYALSVLQKNFDDIATWNRPEGGFYIWMTINKRIQMEELFKRAIKEKILLNIGDIYDFERNNSLRLSYAYTNQDEFEVSAKKLSSIIRELLTADINT